MRRGLVKARQLDTPACEGIKVIYNNPSQEIIGGEVDMITQLGPFGAYT